MATKSYKEFRDAMRRDIWPAIPGEARNLRDAHNSFFREAMVEASKWVRCLQQNNTNVFPFCSTLVECAKTIIELPKGSIKRVYTIANNDWCDPVDYAPWSFKQLSCWARNLACLFTDPPNTGYPVIQQGMKYAESSTDISSGRARVGAWSIHRMRLYLAPWIQSNESVVVEWSGVKDTWNDDDLVDEELWDTPVREFIKLFVRWKHEEQFGADRQKTMDLMALQATKLADIIHDCDVRLRQPPEEECEQGKYWPSTSELTDDAVPEEETSYVFANIGDLGGTGNDEATGEVADLIKSWTPQFIVTNGDNQYSNPAAYTGSPLHLNYSAYITSDLSTNKFFPSLGNHDFDGDPTLSAFKAFFTLPNNERYYDFSKFGGLVHHFIYNTEETEDGYISGSKQAEWLQLKLGLSTARWKIVIFHRPPYTTKATRFPGFTAMRLPFKTWGADLIIGGHFHAYIRFEVDGLPYIVNGCGGAYLDSIGEVEPSPHENETYMKAGEIFEYGAIQLTVSRAQLIAKFINVDGTVKDTLTLEKS